MFTAVALFLFSAPAVQTAFDGDALAIADRSGVVRASFDGGVNWLVVVHCTSAPDLEWDDGDLVVACDQRKRQFDGAELRAHWRLLAAPVIGSERPAELLADRDRRRRARLRGWLPAVVVTFRHSHSSGASGGRTRTVLSLVLRWRLRASGPGGR